MTVPVIQPKELDSAHFTFDSRLGTWKIKDEVLMDPSSTKRYQIVQDNETRQIKFYEYSGELFQPSTASLITTISMVGLDAKMDDIDVNGSVITFKDSNKDDANTLRVDFGEFIKTITTANSNAIKVTGDGKETPLTVNFVVDPSDDNLLSVSLTGAKVSKSDLLAVLKRDLDKIITTELELDETSGKLKLNVNGAEASSVNVIRLVNSAGEKLGFVLGS